MNQTRDLKTTFTMMEISIITSSITFGTEAEAYKMQVERLAMLASGNIVLRQTMPQ
jgi:hypothetical protein